MYIEPAVSYNVRTKSVKIHAMFQLRCKAMDTNLAQVKKPYDSMVCIAKGIGSMEVTNPKGVATGLNKSHIEFISCVDRTYVLCMYPDIDRKPLQLTFDTNELDGKFLELLGTSFMRLGKDFFLGRVQEETKNELLKKKNVFFLVNTSLVFLNADGNVDYRMVSHLNEMNSKKA